MLRSKLLAGGGLCLLALSSWGQSNADSIATQNQKSKPGAAREIGSGAGTVGVGAAKGAGDLAKGTGKGAADLVTLHPVAGGASIGKGAAHGGKDITVGTVKGTGKVTMGIGRAFKHVFYRERLDRFPSGYTKLPI
jgi:hypothetical protein